jgi:signal peptidase I
MTTFDVVRHPATASVTVVGARREQSAGLGWARLAVGVLSRTVLATLIGLLLWAAVPAVIGWTPTTVMTGSMEPRIHPGDIVVARPVPESSIHRGQVLLFQDPDRADHLRLHRYDDNGQGTQIVTKGDANQAADSTPIDRSAVVGVGYLRVPSLGMPFVWAAGHQWAHLLVAGSVLMLLVLGSRADRSLRRDLRAEGLATADDTVAGVATAETAAEEARVGRAAPVTAPDTRRLVRRRERRLRRLRGAVGTLTVAGLVGGLAVTLVVSGGADAAFSAQVANPSSSFGASSAYDCLRDSYNDQTSYGFSYNETSGTTTADGSAQGRVGTLTSGASFVAGSCATNSSPSLSLDGASGQVTTNTMLGGQPAFTIETWFRTTTTRGGTLAGFATAQTGTSTTADRALYMTNSGTLALGVRPTTSSVKSSTTNRAYNDGAWHHVVATFSSTAGVVLYVDGATVLTDTSSKTAQTAAGYWRVGYVPLSGFASAPTSSWFAGQVDGTAIYNNSAQTASAAQARFAAGH